MSYRMPVEVLEARAAHQRHLLHDTVTMLRQTVQEKLDVKRNVREHLWPAAAAAGLLGLALGYKLACAFGGKSAVNDTFTAGGS
ncbi:MAG TPA: hypothetical protein VKZ53_10225 [Candidatus Angelobacter sp.]|nr:hypothetical protein [Candidatus Angelobacter sp.]